MLSLSTYGSNTKSIVKIGEIKKHNESIEMSIQNDNQNQQLPRISPKVITYFS
jgi:hypothetical protein